MTRARDVADRGVITTADLANVPSGAKNLIINGNFDIWQRGTSFTYTGEVYTADRWVSWSSVSSSIIERGEFTVGQTEVPGNPNYYLRFTGNGSETGVRIDQRIEFPNRFQNTTLTVSFYARSSNSMTPGYIYFGIKDVSANTNADNFVNETVQATTSSWQKFTYTITPTAFPTIVDNNIDYAQFGFRIPNNYNGTFDIAQVQLEVGDTATPFEHRMYGTELAMCQRYYQICRDINQSYANAVMDVGGRIIPSCRMRANPTITSVPTYGGNINHNYTYYWVNPDGIGYYHQTTSAGNYYWYTSFLLSSEL